MTALLLCFVAAIARGQAVDSIGITVSEMDRALTFYTNVLTFTVESDTSDAQQRVVRLRLGAEFFVLTDYRTTEGRAIPADSRSNDRWFQHIAIIVSDMDKAYAHLQRHNVEHVSPAPQTIPAWNKAAAGIRAFYFHDPDGHNLEILWFPPGKGAAKWHQTDRLFLGIDHTAIVVSNTEASLKFYRDKLGMTVAGASENSGPEQERLNNVTGARLRITSVRGIAGPAFEFLEYLNPRDGRPFPVDSQPHDLWHWEINLHTPTTSGRLRDPDGHAVRQIGVSYPARGKP